MAQDDPVGWVNSIRAPAKEPPVRADTLLSVTAGKWAAVLAASGTLSHRGADGSSVLDRYRADGGTEAHVGEILGAGPSLAAVEKGWAASPEHRALALDPTWTDTGWGMARSGTAEVWVVLFCEKQVDGLALDETGGGLDVSGSFVSSAATRAVLYAGLEILTPSRWDPASRRFSYTVPGTAIPGYFRLGYVRADGTFRLTNAFTWPPETVSPGAQDHSAAPGRSP